MIQSYCDVTEFPEPLVYTMTSYTRHVEPSVRMRVAYACRSISILYMYVHVPAMGAPTKEDIPWHMTRMPKELVSLLMPIRSTRMMDRRDTNAAARQRWKTIIINRIL